MEKKKTETEMGGLSEDLVGGEWRMRGVETIGGDGSKTGLVMKKGENKSSTSISVPASPGLQGKRGEQQQ